MKDSTITLLTRFLVFLMTMATSVIIARLLGPSQKGTYSLLLLILNTITLLLAFGLGSANVYFGARTTAKLPALAGNSLIAGVVLGVTGILLTALALQIPAVTAYLRSNGIAPTWLLALSLLLPFLLLANFLQEIVRAAGQIVRYNLIALVAAGASLLGAMLFVWYLGWGLAGALATWVFARMAMSVVAAAFALAATQGRLRLDRGAMREGLQFGMKLHPGNIAQFLNYRLDVLLIGLFLAPLQVGLYVTATNLTEIIWEIPHAVRTVLLQRVAASTEQPARNDMTAQVTRMTTTLVGILCLVAAILSYPMIRILYGEPYAPAAAVLVLLLPGIWALSLGKLLAIHLAGSGQPQIGTRAAVASLVATLLLDLLLIPRFGLTGAAVASSVAYILSTVVIVRAYLNTTGQRLGDVAVMHAADWNRLIATTKAFGRS
jgi:O-antigen/teichoic acid export membrane protein